MSKVSPEKVTPEKTTHQAAAMETKANRDSTAPTAEQGKPSKPNDIALQPDGKIVVAGYSYNGIS